MHAQDVWQECLSVVRDQLTNPAAREWFEETQALELTAEKFTLRAPHAFAKDWLQQRYGSMLRDAVSTAVGPDVRIEIVGGGAPGPSGGSFGVSGDKGAPRNNTTAANVVPQLEGASTLTIDTSNENNTDQRENTYNGNNNNRQARQNDTAQKQFGMNAGLSSRYTFDNFVIGASNRFTHAACMSVAEAPATAYNPLFIYGGSGLGKTHLLHAIGRHSLELFDGLQCLYVSTETFVNELINSIKEDRTERFKKRYRDVDLLLVDDIQFLEHKERTQEEFFHTFNALYSANKQIVIASDRPARGITTLEDRLRTRFDSGLTADIQPPDLETRIAILRKISERDSINVGQDVVTYLASRIQHSVRELEGALIRVSAYASLNRLELTIDLAESVIGHLVPEADAAPADPRQIMSLVADYFRVTTDQLQSANRERNLVHARQVAMYLVRENTDLSLPKVGQIFCRDHTTVLHATRRIRELLASKRNVYLQIQELTTRVKANAK